MQTTLLAKLETGRSRHSVDIVIGEENSLIWYVNPERQEVVHLLWDVTIERVKHGWVFSDFWITESDTTKPNWKHKLTLFKKDGLKLEKAIADWKRNMDQFGNT